MNVNRNVRSLLLLSWLCVGFLFAGTAAAQIAFRAAQTAVAAATPVTTITHVGSGAVATATSGSVTPTLPAHAVDDLLVCLVESRDNVAHSVVGWTAYFSATLTNHRASIFYKKAVAAEANPTVAHAGGSSIIAQCSAFRGVDTTTPFDAPAAAQTTNADDKINTGALTTVTNGAMLLIAGHLDDNRGEGTGIAGWNNAFFSEFNSVNDNAIALYYAAQATAGAAGPFQVDTDGDADSHGVLMALRPATPASNSLSIGRPAGLATGDVMLAAIVATPSATGIAAPAGWVVVQDTIHSFADGGGNTHLATYVRAVDDIDVEPANYTWNFSAIHDGAVGGVVAFSGVDTATPVVAHAERKENGNVATSHTAPSINASAADMLVTVHEYQSSGTWTPPGGMGEMVDDYSEAAAGASGVSLSMNHLLLTATGATGTRVASASGNGDEGASQSIALRPIIPATCVTVASGNWDDPAVWDDACHGASGIPKIGDLVVINSGHTVALNVNSPRIAGMTVNSGGSLTNTAGRTLNLGANSGAGTLANNGSLSLGTGTVALSTDYQFTGAGTGTWTLNQLDLGGKNLTLGVGDSYTISFTAATPLLNVGSLNVAGTTNNGVTFRFGAGAQTLPVANVRYPNVVFSGTGAKTLLAGAGSFDVRGSFTLSGPADTPSGSATFSAGSHNVDLYGDFTNNGDTNFNPGLSDSGTWTFRGSALQNVNSTGILTTFPSLTLNNANGLALNASATVKTLLTLTAGYISTGTNILTLVSVCADVSASNGTSWVRTGGFIAGNARLTFATGTTTCTFPVGSGTTYAPVKLVMEASAGGTLTGSTVGNEHPQIATSGIHATKDANRHWSLWKTGDTVTATRYSPTFNFGSGDLDITATATSFVIGKYVAGAWSLPTPVTAAALSTGVTNLAGPLAAVTDFAVGETPLACEPPTDIAGLPAMTCVCDNFGRTSLNPSTIYGQNWSTSTSDTTGILPSIVNAGYLRLTNNTTNNAKAATVPSTFPAAGNLIIVEFKHFAYSGTGADGMALTLSDSTMAPTPGAFGGSLGYAQKDNASCAPQTPPCNGFNGGWVGVAIDEWGNFSAPTEGRSGGPAQRVDSVAVRGSGAGLIGYPYLDGSGTLTSPHGIDSAGSASPAYGDLYRITVDARCYQTNAAGCSNPALDKKTLVKVERNTGSGYAAVVPAFDAYVKNPAQAEVPANWKLSFTGSTGAATNIHEISSLKVCAQAITPPAGYVIQVDNLSPSSCGTAGGNPAAPIVTVKAVDATGNVITNYAQTVTLAAKLLGGGNSAAVWSVVSGGAGGTLTAGTGTGSQTYTFVAGDAGVARFHLADASSQDVYLTVTESAGTPSTSLATPVQYRGGAFTVAVDDALGPTVVAGRPHKITVRRTSCAGGVGVTDTSYSGLKNLDSWYDLAASDHPSGAAAPQICALNGSGSCLPAAGNACTTLSINAPALSATTNNLALTFASGAASFCLSTGDVGKYSIGIRDDTASPVAGSSTTLTVRPFALYFNTAGQGSTANPLGTDKFIPAGDSFEGTVSAVLWNPALDPSYSGQPSVTPQANSAAWSAMPASRTPYFAWPTALSLGSVVSPVGGSGALTGASTSLTSAAYAAGRAVLPAGSLSIDNVGSFLLSGAAANYLNSAGVAVPFISDVIGRFYVDHFTLSGGAVTAACNGFTYMGQAQLGIAYTLTAKNKNDAAATNYTSTLVPTLVAENNNAGTDLAARLSGVGTATWTAGVYTVASSGAAVFSRPNAADGPFDQLAIGIKAVDADGGGIADRDMRAAASNDCVADTNCDAKSIGTTKVRFGMLKVDNASGSERQNLPVAIAAMYYAGNPAGWAVNALDNCTATLALGAFAGNSVTDACYGACSGQAAGAAGSVLLRRRAGDTGAGLAMAAAPTPAAAVTLAAGRGAVVLSAPVTGSPGVPTPGALDFILVAPAWLKANVGDGGTAGSFDWNPLGRVTFGVYGPATNKRNFIYIRENY